MDIVYVRDLRMDARIGIYEWEKRIRQKIRVDLEMGWDNQRPAASDDIKDTLNYKTASKRVMELVESDHYELVERLAETIATTLMQELQIPWIQVTVGKPGAVRGSSEVGVRIERGDRQWQTSS
ncbi:MAG: dihydroneopterin aldolase [Gammaproteobacteria bacterium]|nr:dihydroneopterin aldolase [Gammaproteobacteria bacterium]MBU1725293.1 dihydroneopterin aldolase [Gammaproteobacteria bacterium]MBU2006797.1 dihydroneopterin aldolase [Gammaproteobacteria bacterium]